MSEQSPSWSYSGPDDGSAFPEHLVDMVWSYVTDGFGRLSSGRPHSKAVLRKLVNEIFAASLQTEEGRPVRLQLVLDHRQTQVTTTFDDPLPYTASNLVKLAPSIDIGFRWIVVAPEQTDHDTLKIIVIFETEHSSV